MINSFTDSVKAILERAKTQIQANLANNNINATGRTSASIRVEEYEGGIRLVGGGSNCAPINTLEVGRPGGNVPGGMTEILYQWSIAKGISFTSDHERRTFAYFLKKRIVSEGTLRHQNNVDVYSTIINDAAQQIEGKIFSSVKEQIYSNF